MKGFFGALFRRPVLIVGIVLAGAWLVWVGKAITPRFTLPPIATSRAILSSQNTDTNILRAVSSDETETVERVIGPVTTWKNGLVYWDGAKSCLVTVAPKQKAVLVRPHPLSALSQIQSLSPAPNGVYLNTNMPVPGGTSGRVVFVDIPSGKTRILPGVKEIRSGEQSAAYVFRTPQNTLAVRYPDGKLRSVSGKTPVMTDTWDYDPVRDAVAWRADDGVLHYSSPKQTWQKNFGWFNAIVCNPTNGDLWLQTQRGYGAAGLYVLTETGMERGWRLRGNIPYSAHFMELSPEQEALSRALPNHK